MVAGALAYPFVFLWKRPLLVLACIAAASLLSALVEAILGQWPFWSTPNPYSATDFALREGLQGALRSGARGLPLGFAMAHALIDLGGRDPRHRPDVADGARWAWISVLFSVFVLAPIALAGWFAAGEVRTEGDALVRSAWPTISALGYTAVLAWFGMAWPHALSTERINLRAALRLAGRRFWSQFVVLLLIMIAITGFNYAAFFLPPIPSQALFLALYTLAGVIAAYITAAPLVYIFARGVAPRRGVVAEVFS